MTIAQIKAALGYATMTFSFQENTEGEELDFVKFWDDENRVGVIMNCELFESVKKDRNLESLMYNKHNKVSKDKPDTDGNMVKGTPYTLYSIFEVEDFAGVL